MPWNLEDNPRILGARASPSPPFCIGSNLNNWLSNVASVGRWAMTHFAQRPKVGCPTRGGEKLSVGKGKFKTARRIIS